ncbi:kinesin [Aspergillus niger CBS 101883]|uniref:kinesin n=1 Tax=Aspergillus lacticoffeatus (strain CBS 101883) TaxID=1450533 RepID=UPI000D7EC6AD|nr:kinesin [Aspergillus niger CBS 101883]PYH53123.1 kinesin [Aspergillus niger CBS 101883]
MALMRGGPESLGPFRIMKGNATIHHPGRGEYYLRILSAGADPNIDIIAVHGLNPKSKKNHAEKTWESNGKLWLRDFLPKQLPRARIFLFSYNSKVAIQSSAAGVREQAHVLLDRLRLERENCEYRPLLFIAHSLGGIVVKEALVQAKLSTTYGSICTSTFGIAFFGTPHRGTHLARVGGVAAKFVRAILGTASNTLLKALSKGSLYALELSANFDKLLENYKYLSFYETLPFKSIGIVVEKESAVLGLPDSREKAVALNADHEEICRFHCDKDDRYQYVSSLIVELANSGTEIRPLTNCFDGTDSALLAGEADPCFWMVPFTRNPGFVGREHTLSQVMERIMPLGKAHSRVALYGLGGVGKTQIAIELAHQVHEAHPDASVFWIHANSISRFQDSYYNLIKECEIESPEDKTDNLKLVKQWLEKQCKRWLLIIDNADQASLFTSDGRQGQEASTSDKQLQEDSSIVQFLPESSYGSILITTRNRAAGVKFVRGIGRNMLEVDTMTKEESRCLIKSALSGNYPTESDMDELAGLLDYLPLAIMQAASFMEENVLTVNEYIKLHNDSDETKMSLLCEPFETLGRDSETPNALATTLIVSLDHINTKEHKAIEALSLIAFLDQHNIPSSLMEQRLVEPLDLAKALGTLKAFSLIIATGKGQNFSIHRLVQLTVRKWLIIEHTFDERAIQAMDTLAEVYPNAEYENWAICAAYLPHAVSVLKFIPELHGKQLRRRLYLQEGIAYYLWSQGRDDEAERLDLLIVEENKKEFGIEHPETLESIAGLSSTYSNQNRLAETEELNSLLVTAYTKLYGPNDIITMRSMRCLAATYRKQCRFEEAESLLLEVQERAKSVFGEEHEESITAMGHLGLLYEDLGRWEEAEECTIKDLEWHQKNLGPDNPWTLDLACNLASLYETQGKLLEGKALGIQTLQICEDKLGLDDERTRNCQQLLVNIYYELDEWQNAEGLCLQILEGTSKIHGPTHFKTLSSKQQLAAIYEGLGDDNKAEKLDNEIIDECTRTFGSDHPYTLKFTALAQRRQGNDAEAIKLMAQAINKEEVLLGAFHDETLASVRILRLWCEPERDIVDILLEAEADCP